MSWFVTNVIATLLLPPLSLLLLLALGLFLTWRKRKIGRPLIALSFILLWLSATPYVTGGGLRWLDSMTAPLASPPAGAHAEAIVILGGGSYFNAPEYDGTDTVNDATLLRLRYGAHLYRETGKPILVTGGKPLGNPVAEAQQMKAALEQDFGVPVRWTEDNSDNTYENALYSYRLLHAQGIRRIVLVTHAWHMPRAADIFRRAGFEVVEAPTAFTTRQRTDLLALLPRGSSMHDSQIFVHELIGLVWYRVKSAFS